MNNPAATLLLVLAMAHVAAREMAARPERGFKGHSNLVIGFISVGLSTFVTSILALTTAIRPQPWYDPHYAVPLAGIILGNVLNSASLSLDGSLGSVRRERQAIEARPSLSAAYRQAIAPLCAKPSGGVCYPSSIKCPQQESWGDQKHERVSNESAYKAHNTVPSSHPWKPS
jgi:putative ABC transport system permease protein